MTFFSWVLSANFAASGLGMLILASADDWRTMRLPLRLVGAAELAMALAIVLPALAALGAIALEQFPPCDQLSGFLWWMAGCAFMPMVSGR